MKFNRHSIECGFNIKVQFAEYFLELVEFKRKEGTVE